MANITENTIKQDKVLMFIKQKEPVDQADIARNFLKKFDYSGMPSARVSIGQICRRLEGQGRIHKKTERNLSRGQIEKNVWHFTKNL